MDYCDVLGAVWTLILKCINDKFVSYKHAAFLFTRHLLMDWSRVDYLWIIVMF